jgi:hypothetical protein
VFKKAVKFGIDNTTIPPHLTPLPRRTIPSKAFSFTGLPIYGQWTVRENIMTSNVCQVATYREIWVAVLKYVVFTNFMCILYNQRDATYTMFFIIIDTVRVSGCPSAHHQEPIKLYVQSWVLSFFPAVYRWCGRVGVPTHPHQR